MNEAGNQREGYLKFKKILQEEKICYMAIIGQVQRISTLTGAS